MKQQIVDKIEAFPIWLQLFIFVITMYSVTRLVVTDDFAIFKIPREWIKEHFPPEATAWTKKPPRGEARRISNGTWVVDKGHWLGELISCPWCASFWITLVAWPIFLFWPVAFIIGAVPLATRALVGLIAKHAGG